MNNYVRISWLFILFVLPVLNAQKQSDSLHFYIQKALESNTEIIAAQLAATASEQDSRLSSAVPDPAFMIEGRGIPMDISRFGETRELMFMLEQLFPARGSLELLEQRGLLEHDIKNEMLAAVENDIVQQVKINYYKMQFIESALATNLEHITLVNELEKIAENKYIVGQTGQQDLYQIKIEQARLDAERLSLEEKRATLIADFNRLLNRNMSIDIRTSGIDANIGRLSIAMLDSVIDRTSPFLRAAQIRIHSSENDVELARANKRPSFKVMGGYMAMNGTDDALMGRVGMTLPFLPWSNKDTHAAVEKSKVLLNKAEFDYKTMRDRLVVSLNQRTNEMNKIEEQIGLYDNQIIPASRQIVTLSITGYQADSVDFLSLIQYAREQRNHELRRDELASEYWQKVAQLEYALGTSLDEVIK